jgi:hypothetical protein
MSALTKEMMVDFETWRDHVLTLKQGEKVFKGGFVMGDPSVGKVLKGASSTTCVLLGLALETVDASSSGTNADTDLNVDFLQELKVLWRDNDGSIDASDIFNPCYVVDDHTVSENQASTRILAGTILAVDDVLGVAYAVGRPFLENT